jgi:hypothetical protein
MTISFGSDLFSWSAVVRGAVLGCAEGDIVESRTIRAAYGIGIRIDWDPEIHESAQHQEEASKNK